jgi:hypothetical protein
MASRYECTELQIILIIPEMSIELNKVVILLTEWLELDKMYTHYVLNDLRIIDKQRRTMFSNRQSNERLFNQLNYRIQLVLNTLDQKQNELGVVEFPSADEKDADENGPDPPEEEISYTKAYSNLDCKTMLDRAEREVNKHEQDLKKMCRQVTLINKKQKRERYLAIEALRKKLTELTDVLMNFYHNKRVKQSDLDLLEFAYIQYKEILIYKQCSDNLSKIFYEIELPSVKITASNHLQYSPMSLSSDVSTSSGNLKYFNLKRKTSNFIFPFHVEQIKSLCFRSRLYPI